MIFMWFGLMFLVGCIEIVWWSLGLNVLLIIFIVFILNLFKVEMNFLCVIFMLLINVCVVLLVIVLFNVFKLCLRLFIIVNNFFENFFNVNLWVFFIFCLIWWWIFWIFVWVCNWIFFLWVLIFEM